MLLVMGLEQHLGLLQADVEAEVLGCIREVFDDVGLPQCGREGRSHQQTADQ